MRRAIFAMGLVVLAMGVAIAAPRAEPGVHASMAASSIDSAERTGHLDTIRRGLARHSALENRHIDINVLRLSVTYIGNQVEIVAEINFVLSTTGDHIVSFGNQTAKVLVPRSQFHISKLPALRREVLENALGDLRRKLRAFVPRTTV